MLCCLQIEHHLFPAISFMHYPAIAAIVADECKKRGIQVSKPLQPMSALSKFMTRDCAGLAEWYTFIVELSAVFTHTV